MGKINWGNIVTGGLSGLVGGGLGILGGLFGRNQAERQAEQSQANALALLKEQEGAQSRLNAENAETAYRYGEMSADQAWQRARADYEMEKKDNSIESIIGEAKAAGVNPLAILGGGAGGAGGASVGNAAQGSGAGRLGGNAPNYLEVEAAKQQRKMADAEIQRTVNESMLINAERRKLNAETRNIEEETETGIELTPIQKELLRQQGIREFIDNARKEWENTWKTDEVEVVGNKALKYTTVIGKGGQFDEKTAAEIAKIVSEAELNTERKKLLWEDLLNATKNAETERIKAKAVKLAAEWSTGEYTNWKTWTEVAGKAVDILTNLIKE